MTVVLVGFPGNTMILFFVSILHIPHSRVNFSNGTSLCVQ